MRTYLDCIKLAEDYTQLLVVVNVALELLIHPPTNALNKYYIKNQQDATLVVLFISNCKITLHVSDAFCVHHLEY